MIYVTTEYNQLQHRNDRVSNIKLYFTEKKKDALIANREYVPLLTWKFVNDKMAWGVLLLMGGGFAVADGCAVSSKNQKYNYVFGVPGTFIGDHVCITSL